MPCLALCTLVPLAKVQIWMHQCRHARIPTRPHTRISTTPNSTACAVQLHRHPKVKGSATTCCTRGTLSHANTTAAAEKASIALSTVRYIVVKQKSNAMSTSPRAAGSDGYMRVLSDGHVLQK
eukprot:m.404849 g.404849  ORF g.404849 m.404849 type:complete len:123 (+) comp21202_c0_seq3:436-804(+)